MSEQNLLYLYDLPKDSVSLVKIAEIIKNLANIEIHEIPQIRRDNNKPFFSAIIKFADQESLRIASEKLKYF